jgi:hypothetical protein
MNKTNMNIIAPTATTTTTNIPACLQEVDGYHLIAVEVDGMMYAGLACVIAPRIDVPLGYQAFTEMDDANELPPLADIPGDMPNVSEPPLPLHPDLAPLTVSSI